MIYLVKRFRVVKVDAVRVYVINEIKYHYIYVIQKLSKTAMAWSEAMLVFA